MAPQSLCPVTGEQEAPGGPPLPTGLLLGPAQELMGVFSSFRKQVVAWLRCERVQALPSQEPPQAQWVTWALSYLSADSSDNSDLEDDIILSLNE